MPPRKLRHNIEEPQTERKPVNQNDCIGNNLDVLPEAQVTSFFKMAAFSNANTETSPKKED